MITVHNGNRTLAEVRQIPLVRPPKAGGYWRGVAHGDLMDALLLEFANRGWEVGDMQFSSSRNGSDLAAAFDLSIPDLEAPDGTRFALGLMNDNARQRALRIYVGATVSVCRNGLATGQIVLNRRHTQNLRLGEQIHLAMDDYRASAEHMSQLVEGLQWHDLTRAEYEHILIEAGRLGLMPWSRLGDVDREYCVPRFAEEIEPWTSWALLNAFTWVAKRNPPRRQMDQIDRFRELLPTTMVV